MDNMWLPLAVVLLLALALGQCGETNCYARNHGNDAGLDYCYHQYNGGWDD